MVDPKELDIFSRSLSGDRQARVELFKKYIWENSRVRRLANGFRSPDDFLHDCFSNVLRASHSFNKDESLSDWVESVAAWTSVERQRFRDNTNPEEAGRVRLYATQEGDEAKNRSRLDSYAPPYTGKDDSAVSRLAKFAGEAPFALVSKRGIENRTWEAIAEESGKPLNTIGPAAVKAVDRIIRLCGAPPPLNADLEPVFASAARRDASSTGGDPSKPRGRIQAMQLDPAFYAVTPQMRKIGLTVPSEVRTMVLWDAARASTPPEPGLQDHLAKCSYCTDVLRALLLMQQILQKAPSGDFLLCPGGFTLLHTVGGTYAPLDQHLAECELCRKERDRLLNLDDAEAENRPSVLASASVMNLRMKIACAVAGVLLILAGGYFMRRPQAPAPPKLTEVSKPEPPPPPLVPTERYRSLVQNVEVNDPRWMAAVLPENRPTFRLVLDEMQSGHLARAEVVASGLSERDPGWMMLYSVILYRRLATAEGYRAMQKSEAMSPRQPFRCWAMMQCAFLAGDMKAAERETEHLASDPDFGPRAKALLARAKAMPPETPVK